jgi:diguanylate cyclase (GGDEF)-like protein/PAS domain S-box-containing protein
MPHRLDALFKSGAPYSYIVENADEGIWIGDANNNVWYVNPKMAEILGYTKKELMGISNMKLVAPEDIKPLAEKIKRQSNDEKKRYELKLLHKDGHIVYTRVSSSILVNDKNERIGTLAAVTDISDIKRELEINEFLAKATGILASSLDYKTTLATVAKLAVPQIADWCAVDMMGESSKVERVALEHIDPSKVQLAYDFEREFPTDPASTQGVYEVIRTGKSQVVEYISDELIDSLVKNERQKKMIYALELRSYMIMPLTARGKTFGALTFVSNKRYTQRDVLLAEELANYAALAIDNSHLHTAAQTELKERIQAEAKIKHQALHDALTNLPNRIFLLEQLTQACQRASRAKKLCGILFLDLDRFKLVNDSLGHHAGDELLKLVADRLLECLGPNDTVARFGGDEFVIITSDATSEKEVIAVTQRIFNSFESPLLIHGKEIYVNTSIGVSIYPNDSKDTDSLLKHADSALYCAKDLGRNTYCLYSSQDGKNAGKRLTLETDLRNALKARQFELYYQPVYSLREKKIVSAEALIRWNHPVQGLLSPSSFLPYAEDIGIIHKLGEWVITEACKQLVQWSKTELKDLSIAVNISPLQFFRSDFIPQFKKAVAASKADPKKLTIELTERLAMQDIQTVIARLQELKELGVGIAVDDFGVGHSSLSYLKQLPLDTLKIDRSFVQSSPINDADDAIVSAVATLARRLKMRVVAEGVEDTSQLFHLQSNNTCDEIQGYVISEALKAQDFKSFIQKDTIKTITSRS